MSFDEDTCFLCGSSLAGAGTREHVFPKWLCNRNALWDEKLTLLNRTAIPYRQLTVPCCDECNQVHLASLEGDVADAFSAGYEGVRVLDQIRLFQWMAKIHYGILFKEFSLVLDRRNPKLGTILNEEILEDYRSLHGMLQSVRRPFEFLDPKPWSIFVVQVHEYPGQRYDFDYHDGILQPTFAIRFGGVGLFAHLLDNGTQAALAADFWAELEGMTLHPLQWEELWVNVNDTANRTDRVPKGLVLAPEMAGDTPPQPVHVVSIPIQGMSSKPIYLECDSRERAEMLLFFWNQHGMSLSLDDVFRPPDEVWTMLRRQDGSLHHLDANGRPL